jgi:two-component system, NtrC family, nitrogen regulation sensor histidine kinase GlnL
MTGPAFEDIWVALPIPAFVVDKANRLSSVNPAAEVFLNNAQKTMSGKEIAQVMKVDIALDPNLDRARADQSVLFHHDVSINLSAGEVALCDIQMAPLSDADGAMVVLLHPRQIKGRLGRALQVNSSAKTAIGLADMLAHEIKNPLAGITGAAQLLAMGLGKQDQEMTDLILQETRRIVDLLKQVEQFGDLRPPKLKPLNIHDLLEKTRISASYGAASNMRFLDQYDPSLPLTYGDADQLSQVFSNLFANAAEAAKSSGGTITIRTYYEIGLRLRSQNGGQAVPLQIEVIDDGPGIADNILDHVFDPFISTRENGTGLGLALVSKILAEHHGAIVVKSRPGKTVFRISLPMAPKSTNVEGGAI